MTHKDLVKKAIVWLKNNQRCTVVVSERGSAYVSEQPDGIGFKGGFSILVECKASRVDFLKDSKKHFRECAWAGMGQKRYYMTPKGLIKPDELPPNWGLIEVYERQCRIKHDAEVFEETNKHNEVAFLTSVIRRLEISATVFVQQETGEDAMEVDG